MFHNLLNSILKKKLYLFITVFVVLVVGISLGSAILTKTLSIGGKTKIQNNWIIYFDKVVLNNNSVKNNDTSKDAKIVDFEKQNIEFSANLSSIDDFYEFDVYTVNDGNVDAMIDSIELTGLEGNEEYISYDVNYDDATLSDGDEYYSNKYTYSNDKLKPCDPLYGETRRKIKVRISLKKELEDDEPINLHLGFKINYVQWEPNCNSRHTLTIDPNGGIYEGRLNRTEKQILNGNTELIKVPKKGDQDFLGWEIIPTSGTYIFNPLLTSEQQFTMGEEDVTIRAIWDENYESKNYVARIMNTYYLTIQAAFDDVDKNWSDNTVFLLRDTTENAVNNATHSFTFNLGGHTITGSPIDATHDYIEETINTYDETGTEVESRVTGTIINSSNGNIRLINGSIVAGNDNDDTTINSGIVNYGTVTLGVDDDNIEVNNSISITGNGVGITNFHNSYMNIYDGYIDAIDNDEEIVIPYYFGNSDNVTRVVTPNNYSIVVDTVDNGKRAYLTRDPNRKVAKTETNGTIFYANLQDAINTATTARNNAINPNENYYKIYAIRDFDAPYSISIGLGESVYFDLIGFDVSFGENVTNNGKFTLLNSKQYSQIDERSNITTDMSIINNGTMTINNINVSPTTNVDTITNNAELKINDSKISGGTEYGIRNNYNGTLDLNSGAIIRSDETYGLYNDNNKYVENSYTNNVLTIDDGLIYGIYNGTNAKLKIEGNVTVRPGEDSQCNAIYNSQNAEVTMNGGQVLATENVTAIDNRHHDSVFNLIRGDIQTKYNAVSNSGTFNVLGGTVYSESSGIVGGTIYINSGTITSKDSYAVTQSDLTIECKDSQNNEQNNEQSTACGQIISENDIAVGFNGYSNITINGGKISGKIAGISTVGGSARTLNMNGGIVESDGIAIDGTTNPYTYFTMNISGGTVKGKTAGIVSSDYLYITGGTIEGKDSENSESTAIGVIVTNRETYITGGTIKGDLYGVHNEATLTIGENDENIERTSPVIIGNSYGLYIDDNKTTNFYDGILKGIIDGYHGNITALPLGAVIGEGSEIIEGNTYNTDFVSAYENWLRVGDREFNTINAASQYINGVGKIEVIKNADISFAQTVIDTDNNKTITLDLNGYTITTTQPITNESDLTIIDSSNSKTGTFNITHDIGIINSNKLTLNGGKYLCTTDYPFQNNSQMIVDDAEFDVSNIAISNGKSGYTSASLVINDINITNSYKGVENSGTVTMNDGNIKSSRYGIYNNALASSTLINGGKIDSEYVGISADWTASVTVNNGEIISNTDNAIYTYDGPITINNGTITSKNNIAIYSSDNIIIYSGNITGTVGVNNDYYKIGNYIEWRNITIHGGTITGTSTNGVNANGGTLLVDGGLIIGKKYGLYNYANAYIGHDDNNISIESPEFRGEDYGLVTEDYIRFYDGIIKSKFVSNSKSIHNGLISLIPDGTMIREDEDTINGVLYKTEYLTEYDNWIRVGDKEFNSINAAVKEIGTTGTMVVIANPYVGFEQTIPSGKNITLDLNGHSLIMTQPIVNNGNLSITDSTASGDNLGGSINNLRDSVLVNNGNLTINSGIYATDDGNTLKNSGTLTMNNAKILSSNSYGVYNDGTFTMNGGIINTYGGVDNEGGTFIMEDGNIESTNRYGLHSINSTITINGGTIKNTSVNKAILIENDSTVTINGGTIESDLDSAVYISRGNNQIHLIVNGGNIISKTYGIADTNLRGGISDVTINGGTIESDEYGIDCWYTSVYINGGYIHSKQIGVYNLYEEIIMTGGTVYGELYGIQNNNTLTLGNNDETISSSTPVIIGDHYAVYNEDDTFNFYDGILKGNAIGSTDVYYGDITAIPDRTDLIYGNETIGEKTYDTLTIIPEVEKIEIIRNGTRYKTYKNLQDAFDEAIEDDILKVLCDFSIFTDVTNNNSNNITLDLDGHKIVTFHTITNKGNLQMINNSQNDATIQSRSAIDLIVNEGYLKIENVDFNYYSDNTSHSVIYGKSGELYLKNLNISTENTDVVYAKGDKVTIDNCELTKQKQNSSSVTIKQSSDVLITNSTIKGLYNDSCSNIQITDSTINEVLYNYSSTVVFNDSIINGYITTNYYSIMTINNSTINYNNSNYYINTAIDNSGKLYLNSSTINANNSEYVQKNMTVIRNYGSIVSLNSSNINLGYYYDKDMNNTREYIGIYPTAGNIYLNNSNISVVGGNKSYGIYSNDSNVNITMISGIIDVRKSNESYGVYMEKGNFIIGENDNVVYSKKDLYESPKISAYGTKSSAGVKREDGTFEFYDGIVYASNKPVPEIVNRIAYPYEVSTYIEQTSGNYYAVIEDINDDYRGNAVALYDGIYYMKIQDAINHANENKEIKILQSTTENLIVNKAKSVKINLNGKSVTTTLDNRGTINIYDGVLQNVNGTVVNNTGTFIMGKDDNTISSTSVRLVSNEVAINNTSTFKMYDGYIEGNPSINGEINERPNNTRIFTYVDSQFERKYLQSLSLDAIRNKETDLFLTINPAGGQYESSTNIRVIPLKYEDTYELGSNPVKANATFIGWEVSDSTRLSNNIITMGEEDITLVAQWMPNSNIVAQIRDTYFTSLSDAIATASNGDTIILLKDTDENIINDKSITIDLRNKKKSGSLRNDGNLTLLNGIIENLDGIAIINNGTLTIGEDDGEISTDSIQIIGNTIGIKQNGTLNFYDGSVKGTTAVDGIINSIPSDCYINSFNDDGKQIINLIENLSDSVAIISNGGNMLYYSNLQSAIDSAVSLNKEIIIIKDFTANYDISVEENENVVINLNRHNIILSNNISNEGNLKIYDTNRNNNSITINNAIDNNGILELNNITINQITANDAINNSGTLKLNSSKVNALDGYAINHSGALEINGDSELLANNYSLYNNQSTPLTLNNGTFTGIKNNTQLVLTDDVVINSTNPSGACVFQDAQYAEVTVNGGVCNANTYGIYSKGDNQKITVTDGKIITDASALYYYSSDNTTLISGGTIISNEEYGIYFYSGGSHNIDITGGVIEGAEDGVYHQNGTINVTGGEFRTTSTSIYNSALYCYNDTCNVGGNARFIADSATGIKVNLYSESNITGGYIYSGAINGNGIKIDTDEDVNISGDIHVVTSGNSSIGINIVNDNNITIDNVNVESGNIGIDITSGTTLNINNGQIKGDLYGIRQYSSSSIVNIGSEDEQLSSSKPFVTGGTYGIYQQSGKSNFYNGKLRGTIKGYSSTFSNIRTSKDIYEYSDIDSSVSNIMTYSTTDKNSNPVSNNAKIGNGYAKITYIDEAACNVTKTYEYDYSGFEVNFTTPCTGKYKLEVWGAQGGGYDDKDGGYGGYSYGEISLTAGESLYINVGGQGTTTPSTANSLAPGGYNGGGDATNSNVDGSYSGSGGGATHIATSSGLLKNLSENRNSILIVAGGGGGYYYAKDRSYRTDVTGSGGGYSGGNSIMSSYSASGGTQNNGYAFGYAKSNDTLETPGAGGGYYSGNSNLYTAGGGSGYIANSRLENAYMYGYNVSHTPATWVNDELTEKGNFLQVGSQQFNSFKSALSVAGNTGTIMVINDAIVNELVEISSGTNITIDMNNHNLTMTNSFVNNGTLTINNNGTIDAILNDLITTNGDLTLEDLTLKSIKKGIIITSSNKTISLDNVLLETSSESIYMNDSNSYSNTLTINDSSIKSTAEDVIVSYSKYNNLSTINISDSSISAYDYVDFSYCNIGIDNTTITSLQNDRNNPLIYLNSSTLNVINGSEITSSYSSGVYLTGSTLNVTNSDVLIDKNKYAIRAEGTSTVNINGNSKITSKLVGVALAGSNTTLNMNNGQIISEENGINVTSGSANIIDGEIKATQYGVYIEGTNSLLTIGTSVGDLSIEKPSIKGDLYGVYRKDGNEGVVNFYSGKLSGKEYGYYDKIDAVRTGMKTYETLEIEVPGDLSTKYVVNYLGEKEGFLKVGTKTYNSFEKALEAVGNTGTIIVLSDSNIQETVEFNGEDITLDLNGHELTFNSTITNSGKLTIEDSKNTNGKIDVNSSIGIQNNGDLFIESGYIKAGDKAINVNTSSRSVIVDGGKLEAASCTINFESGSATSSANSTLTINGGQILATSDTAICNYLSSYSNTINITGGSITGEQYAMYLDKADVTIGNATLENKTTENKSVIYARSTNLILNNGANIISEHATGIDFGGNLTINDGSLIDTYDTGIIINASTDMTMLGGNIKSNNIGLSIWNGTDTINIYGGNIYGYTYGIFQDKNTSTLNIGDSTGSVSKEEPEIIGGTYGLYRTAGKTYFYSGILKGTTGAYYPSFNGIRENYEVYGDSTELPTELKKIRTLSVSTSSTEALENTPKEGNGYARITYLGATTESCASGTVFNYTYTGTEKIFTVPCSGSYKLEVWGAQGGKSLCNEDECGNPGYGGYSTGIIDLNKNEMLYINVGGQGGVGSLTSCSLGGYNGGGYGTNDGGSCGKAQDDEAAGGGGGATHIALSSGLLSTLENNKNSILIVAGGGGGASWTYTAGSGGGHNGGVTSSKLSPSTNISGYAFGQGQNGSGSGDSDGVAGGGGGYYGGYTSNNAEVGGGGSGYTSNSRIYDTYMYGYNIQEFYPLGTLNVAYLNNVQYYVKNARTNNLYTNLQTAINEANSGDTLEFVSDANISYDLTIDNNDNITLDLNGKDIYTSKSIINNGTLTIKSTDLKSTLSSSNNILISNNGTLNIDNVDLEGTTTLNNNGSYTITNSTINGTSYGIYDSSTNTNTISNSTVTSNNNSIYNYSTSTINIGGSIIEGLITTNNIDSKMVVDNNSTINGSIYNMGEINISQSSINYKYGSNYDYIINNNGTLVLNNNQINHITTDTYMYISDLVINKGTLTSTSNTYKSLYNNTNSNRARITRGIYNESIITSTSDTFIMSNSNEAYAIYNNSSNQVIINNISINISNSTDLYGIYINDGIIKLYNGNILLNGDESYGIYLASGTLELGENDNNVKVDTPYIKSLGTTSGYGIYMNDNTDTFNFYDGYIMGSTSPKNGNVVINSKPNGYTDNVKFDNETGYNYIILEEE